MSNVIKAYTVRYDEVAYKTLDFQIKLNTSAKVRPITAVTEGEQQGEFVEGLDALFVESLSCEEDSSEKVSEIIEKANLEAQIIIERARQDAEQIKKDAFSSAKREGYEEGRLQAKNENLRLQAEYEQRTIELQNQYESMMSNVEPEIANIIGSLVTKITGVMVEGREDVILYLIRQSIKDMDRSVEYTIRVSEEDYEYVSMRKDIISEAIGREVDIYIDKDHKLLKNQCLIETELQLINCSLDVQLDNLITDLKLIGNI